MSHIFTSFFEFKPTETLVHRVKFRGVSVNEAGTEISGFLQIEADQKKGKYRLQVFKGGGPPGELADAVEIK
jgi:hypothetical protein